jgi:hypothetical protein
MHQVSHSASPGSHSPTPVAGNDAIATMVRIILVSGGMAGSLRESARSTLPTTNWIFKGLSWADSPSGALGRCGLCLGPVFVRQHTARPLGCEKVAWVWVGEDHDSPSDPGCGGRTSR